MTHCVLKSARTVYSVTEDYAVNANEVDGDAVLVVAQPHSHPGFCVTATITRPAGHSRFCTPPPHSPPTCLPLRWYSIL